MQLFETNLKPIRNVWESNKNRQSLQMILYQALANSTDLPAKNVEDVLEEVGRLLEREEEEVNTQDESH